MSARAREIARRVVASACVGMGIAFGGAASAGPADVIAARIDCDAERVCVFDVTIKHADTGWKHYADRFEILDEDETVLGTRVLRHPHVHEQPFTRRLAGVEIPAGTSRVVVRARDSVHGEVGKTVTVDVPAKPAAAEAP